ncbi:MAG: hypothetical protein QM727_08435 [Niabella sp.]
MKKYIVFTIAVSLFFVACNSKKEMTPADFNETVVNMEQSLEEPLLKAEAEIKVRSDRQNWKGMSESAKSIEDSINVRLKKIEQMPAVGVGGEDFKLVAKRYFEYMKGIYTSYAEIANAKDDAGREEASKKMQNMLASQPEVIQNMQASQLKYARENGFVIEE